MVTNEVRDTHMFKEFAPLVGSLGYDVVDIRESVVKGEHHLYLVIRNPKGNTSLKDCMDTHRLVYPRLTILYDQRDVHLEVSSPGIQRKIKDVHEFHVFKGQLVSIMMESEWITGTIFSCDDQVLELSRADTIERYDVNRIKKAKLEAYSPEGN